MTTVSPERLSRFVEQDEVVLPRAARHSFHRLVIGLGTAVCLCLAACGGSQNNAKTQVSSNIDLFGDSTVSATPSTSPRPVTTSSAVPTPASGAPAQPTPVATVAPTVVVATNAPATRPTTATTTIAPPTLGAATQAPATITVRPITGATSAAPVIGALPAGWKAFTSTAGRFSAAMPGTPEEDTQNTATQVGDIPNHTFTLEADTAAYSVQYADYPPEIVSRAAPDTILDGARDGVLNSSGAVLSSQSTIVLDGFPGRAFRYTAPIQGVPGGAVFVHRVYLVGARLYQLIYVVPRSSGVDEAKAGVFLDSFKLIGAR